MNIDMLIYPIIVIMIIMMGVKMIREMMEKNKKPKQVDIPRDTSERLTKAYRTSVRGKLNKEKIRHTLWTSGDELVSGCRVGDVVAKQLLNEEYIIYVKKFWWFFWKKPIEIHLDVELVTDWNAKHVIVECRGFEAVTEGLVYPIPRVGTINLEAIYAFRSKNKELRFLKQTVADFDIDSDISPKIAIRGDVGAAHSEVGRYEEMPQLEANEIKKRQREELRRKYNTGGE